MGTLVYTLKVKYYNALEAITTALNTYFSAPTATNVTYTKTADQQYNVVTHVSSMSEITNGGLISALLTIKDLTKVTLTVGENSTEVTAPTIASDFDAAITWLADQLHWDVSFTDPVTVVMKVEAGDASVDYTFSVTCDYDQIATAKALTDAVLATAHDDEYLTLTPSDDGFVEVVFKKPADQMVDTIGFGNLLKTLPHLKSVTFSMRYSSTGEQTPVTATIDAPVTDGKLAELKTTLGTILPADDTAVLVLSTTKFYYDNVNISDGVDRSTTYEASISSSWVTDPEVIINDTARYHTLAEGLAAATAGDTVTLQKHVTVSNSQVNATPNSPVIVIPDGVIFDGNHKVITADDASWVGTNANHIIGVSNVTATVKNLTVTGNTKTKSGIVCFGQNGNVTLENVVAQNCGNCGVQIAGAHVTATNLQTTGNAWGGVNVDKGSDGSIPSFTVGDNCTFAEKAEVYTEITDQVVITAPNMTKVQGFGTTLKGFIYYTSDIDRLECVVRINSDKYCETIQDAIANAVSGDTITMLDNLSVDNTAVSSNATNPVIVIPDGVTFEGNNKTLSDKSDTWVGETAANHMIGIVNTTGTIKNLTVDGAGKSKAGVIVYGAAAKGTLENVTSNNNGNLGVLIAGATAVATNVNTAGNVWGGINVDKSSTDNGTPNFTFNSGALSENAELYTEITDQDVITAPGMEKVQGFGETLKGFIYYTTDMSRLGTITGEGTVYETLADAAAANGEVAVALGENLNENVSIPAGKSMTIDGAGKTIHGKITCVANGSGETNLTLKNLTLDGTGTGTTYGIISQNQTDNGQMECNLVLENVNITGFASKAIYGTNIKTLTITGGTIADCATGTMDDPNTKGDYAVDLNLVAVQGTVVTIDGVTFSGDLGDKAAIKITQRGGASDAGASDIPKNVGEAHVEKVTIQNCDFSASTTEVDYRIGTDNKTGGDSLNTTGAYAAELINNGEIVVQSAYLVDEPKLTVPAGRDAAKTSATDIAIVLTPEEQLDAIMASIEGATETSNNVYEVTTDTSVSLSFIDQIVAIPGFNNMQVSNGTDTLTYTNDGILETFKSQVAAWMPTTNESPEVTLTITVNFAE